MNNKKYTKEELIEILKKEKKRTHRLPDEFRVRRPPTKTYIKVFGSWEDALEAIFVKRRGKNKTLRDKESCSKLVIEKANKLNRSLREDDFSNFEIKQILKYYNTFSNCLIENKLIVESKIKQSIIKISETVSNRSICYICKSKIDLKFINIGHEDSKNGKHLISFVLCDNCRFKLKEVLIGNQKYISKKYIVNDRDLIKSTLLNTIKNLNPMRIYDNESGYDSDIVYERFKKVKEFSKLRSKNYLTTLLRNILGIYNERITIDGQKLRIYLISNDFIKTLK